MSKAAVRPPPVADPLYEADFYAWTQVQARSLARRDASALDVVNLAEEVESLGRTQRNARNPSLRALPHESLPDIYRDAVRMAAHETRIDAAAFPSPCPFTIGEILDPDFEP